MAASHPTILLGFGRYGRVVLEALLASAASRGVLGWEDAVGGASPAARQLKNLALVAVSYPPGVESGDGDGVLPTGAGSPEILEDLDRQIERVDGAAPAALRRALERAENHLLDFARRALDAQRLRLGLDVIVLAQPSTRTMLGALAELVEEGLDELSNHEGLRRVVEGDNLLNCVEVLDFENYWDKQPGGAALRRDLRQSVERLTSRVPGVSRVYMMDGRTLDGTRSAQQRLDEVVLLLEFLLFEGQRPTPMMQALYRRELDSVPPVAAIGLRVFERGTGRLSRIAAAYFGQGWLEYMAGTTSSADGVARRALADAVDRYRRGRLYGDDERERLRELADIEIAAIENEVLAIDPEHADWPARALAVIAGRLRGLQQRLSARVTQRAAEIQAERLKDFPDVLVEAVTSALHHAVAPERIGTVLHEVRRLLGDDDVPAAPTVVEADAAADAALAGSLEAAHVRYRALRDEQIDPDALKTAWPLFATAVAAGLAPLVTGVLADFGPVDPSAPLWWRRVVEAAAVPWIAVATAALLAAATWLVGRFHVQRAVEGRVVRARRLFTDRDRGRLADAVRAALAEGSVRATAHRTADLTYRELVSRLRSEVQKEGERIVARLGDRQREMRWLRHQLRQYLRMQDVSPDEPMARLRTAGRSQDPFRYSIDRERDLTDMLARNPPGDDRYRSTQSELRPFARWNQRFCDAFLYPVGFLDAVSRFFHDPAKDGAAGTDQADAPARALVEAIEARRVDEFNPGFLWQAGFAASTPMMRFCIVPAHWREVGELTRALYGKGFGDVLAGDNPERAYLVRVQHGIGTASMEGGEEP